MLKLHLFLLKGYFCPTGTTNPQPCPNGYYGNSSLVKRSEDCVPCPAGEFCAGFGLRKPTGLCDAGFYCRGKAFTSVILIFDFLSCPGLSFGVFILLHANAFSCIPLCCAVLCYVTYIYCVVLNFLVLCCQRVVFPFVVNLCCCLSSCCQCVLFSMCCAIMCCSLIWCDDVRWCGTVSCAVVWWCAMMCDDVVLYVYCDVSL